MIEERDISVAMRDGTRLAVDVYRRALTSRTFCRRNPPMHRSGSVPSRRATRGVSSPTATFM